MRQYIAYKARFTSFVDIEYDYDVSDTTIRKVFLEDVAKLTLANGDDNIVMEVLRGRRKEFVKATLQTLQTPNNVKVVTMYMWSGYCSAVKEVLPKALIVVDKFHVVKMASEELDSVRKSIIRTDPHKLKKNRAVFFMREERLSEKGIPLRDEWLDKCQYIIIHLGLRI